MTPQEMNQFINEKVYPTYQGLLDRVAKLESVNAKLLETLEREEIEVKEKAEADAKEHADKIKAGNLKAERDARKEKRGSHDHSKKKDSKKAK